MSDSAELQQTLSGTRIECLCEMRPREIMWLVWSSSRFFCCLSGFCGDSEYGGIRNELVPNTISPGLTREDVCSELCVGRIDFHARSVAAHRTLSSNRNLTLQISTPLLRNLVGARISVRIHPCSLKTPAYRVVVC